MDCYSCKGSGYDPLNEDDCATCGGSGRDDRSEICPACGESVLERDMVWTRSWPHGAYLCESCYDARHPEGELPRKNGVRKGSRLGWGEMPRKNPMTKREANAKMRAKYGPNWFEHPKAKLERAALMRGVAPSKPAARPKPRSKPAAAAPATPARRSSRDPGPPSGVMLAKKWKGSDPTGWWMSEKLDGMRAYWTGHEFYTRNGNLIAAPDWFKAVMPQGVALDGEIYMGRGRFQEVMSVARKATPRDPRWNKVCFMAFDAPEVPGGCEARFRALEGFVDDACRRWRGKGRCPLVFVEQRRCASRRELDRFHKEVEKLRGEGVMLRAPGSRYARSRTSDLLKVKSFIDTEARITGYTAGTGKHKGRLGAYKAKLLSSGVEFKIGTGISDRERDRPLPRGTVVTVRFQEYTNAGVPRFPSLVGARDYE